MMFSITQRNYYNDCSYAMYNITSDGTMFDIVSY